MLFIYIYVPIIFSQGNNFRSFLNLTPWYGFLFLILLSFLMGLLIVMQLYLFNANKKFSVRGFTGGIIASFSSIISGIFSSASCAACLSVFFSFLGTSGTLFLLNYRWEIAIATFLMVVISIYLTSKKINNKCMDCMPENGKPNQRRKRKN
jgi:uncharacterized oligopeptide transporter (OPT) family protein